MAYCSVMKCSSLPALPASMDAETEYPRPTRNLLDKQTNMRTDRAAMLMHSIGSQECQPYTLADTLAKVSCLRLSCNSREMQRTWEQHMLHTSSMRTHKPALGSCKFLIICRAQHCMTHNLQILHLLHKGLCRKATSGAYHWAGAGLAACAWAADLWRSFTACRTSCICATASSL